MLPTPDYIARIREHNGQRHADTHPAFKIHATIDMCDAINCGDLAVDASTLNIKPGRFGHKRYAPKAITIHDADGNERSYKRDTNGPNKYAWTFIYRWDGDESRVVVWND
tara:strand:+ start:158 stop:487 length:330 start_codon:yes stop_codon:yes gene_type:complete